MNTLQEEVNRLKRKFGTWQKTANEIGISRSHAWNIAHGKSDSVTARHYFGLPPKMVMTEPCRLCGDVHQFKTCTSQRKKRNIDRMAASLSKEDGQIIRDNLKRLGYESITEYWHEYLFNYCLKF